MWMDDDDSNNLGVCFGLCLNEGLRDLGQASDFDRFGVFMVILRFQK